MEVPRLPEETRRSAAVDSLTRKGFGYLLLHADGYKVVGTALKPEKATDLKATGATIVKLDVTSEEDIAAMAKTLKGQKIDILINNAGYFGPKLMTENPDNITKLTRQEMTTCINVNTLGPIFVTQALLPNLRLSPMKKVVNISTRAASPGGTAYGYRISKTALNMVTRCMSVDAGIDETFPEIVALVQECKFSDCSHASEKGCAILRALENGELSEQRYGNYIKMRKESTFHEMSYSEKRKKDKDFGKMIKSVIKNKRR